MSDQPVKDLCLSVRDLSVAFRSGGRETLAVDRVSFDIVKGECLALVGESGSGKSVTALSILRLLPYPAAHHPSGSINFHGRDLLKLSEREMRQVRGDDITIVFQEPMTSLNPLHTIEKQIGEILLLHRGLTGAPARARTLEVLSQVGIRDPENSAQKLSASALRRPASARNDRYGARQRARSADRRRADHRPRRHGAGADHRAAEGYPVAAAHVASVHHPRPRHRAKDRAAGLRDEGRQDRRARHRRTRFLRAASIRIRARCSPPNRGPIRRRRSPTRRCS